MTGRKDDHPAMPGRGSNQRNKCHGRMAPNGQGLRTRLLLAILQRSISKRIGHTWRRVGSPVAIRRRRHGCRCEVSRLGARDFPLHAPLSKSEVSICLLDQVSRRLPAVASLKSDCYTWCPKSLHDAASARSKSGA